MHKLDNPVWSSLSETHKPLSINFSNARFYHPDYCPFGSCERTNEISRDMDAYAQLVDNFYIVGKRPSLSTRLVLKNELVCLQMVADDLITREFKDPIRRLNDSFEAELYELVNLVQPGYFKTKTSLMGSYYGIFRDNRLVAVTGERMKMNGFTEVSAVVTHTQYTGRGYAKDLVSFTTNKIFGEDRVPFLHVAETNSKAIALYDQLGFKIRRKISFWHFSKQS